MPFYFNPAGSGPQELLREDLWKLNGNLKAGIVDAVSVEKISKAEESSGQGLGKYLGVLE